MTSLTLFADASYCNRTGAGGWGAWYKMEGMEQGELMGGTFKSRMASSAEAELAALVNALARLSNGGRLANVTLVMLQSDCMRALQAVVQKVPGTIRKKHKNGLHVHDGVLALSPMESAAANMLLDMKQERDLTIVVRHVKGHTPGGGRAWVNRMCDDIARRHMESERRVRGSNKKGTK